MAPRPCLPTPALHGRHLPFACPAYPFLLLWVKQVSPLGTTLPSFSNVLPSSLPLKYQLVQEQTPDPVGAVRVGAFVQCLEKRDNLSFPEAVRSGAGAAVLLLEGELLGLPVGLTWEAKKIGGRQLLPGNII